MADGEELEEDGDVCAESELGGGSETLSRNASRAKSQNTSLERPILHQINKIVVQAIEEGEPELAERMRARATEALGPIVAEGTFDRVVVRDRASSCAMSEARKSSPRTPARRSANLDGTQLP